MKQNLLQNKTGHLIYRLNRTHGRAGLRILAMAILTGALLRSTAWAQDSWTSAVSGYWTNSASWSLGAAPSNNNVFITNAGGATVTIDAGTPAANLTVSNVNLGSVGGATNTLYLSANSPALSANDLHLGNSGGAGALVVDGGGRLTTAAGYIGENGIGNLTVSNGVWSSSGINFVGYTGKGTVTFAGGTNFFTGVPGLVLGQAAVGTVWLTGGQLVTTNSAGSAETRVGNASVATMTVSNGAWLANLVLVGAYGGSGTLNIAGGTNWINNNLNIGNSASSVGSVLMTGGQLVTTNSAAGDVTYVGNSGVGRTTVSNGAWLADQVVVGAAAASSGTLTFAGGTNVFSSTSGLTVGQAGNATGTVWLTGGHLVTTNSAGNVSTYVGNLGVGGMTVSNGVWLANRIAVGENGGSAGTLILAGGTNMISGTSYGAFQIGDGVNNATGTVLMTGGQLTIATGALYVGNAGVGVMTVSNGTLLGGDSYVAVAGGSRSTLNIAGGTNAFSAFMNVGNSAGATGTVNVTGGNLAVTNTGGTARLVVGASGVGALTLSGGTLTTDQLLVTNGASSSFTFNGGALNTRLALIGVGSVFTVSNNGSAQVGGVITNAGAMTVMNSRVTYGGPMVIGGSYVSDPSTNIFTSNLTTTASGSLYGSNGDLFVLSSDFINQSTNRPAFNLANATVVFTNGNGVAATNHTLDLTGSGAFEMGSNILSIASMSTNFGIGTLSIAASNRLTLTGDHLTNALYVGLLDLSAWNTNAGTSLTNTLQAALNLSSINLYYDNGVVGNAYLQDGIYSLWGGQGFLIPIPEPSTLVLLLLGPAAVLMRRRLDKRLLSIPKKIHIQP